MIIYMIIYMMDKKLGKMAYNIVHSYSMPISIGIIALMMDWQLGILLTIIWFAHIGMDRTVGYGLKYHSDFKDTHLQRATVI